MPGIFGIISAEPSERFRRDVQTMLQVLRYERFYSGGVFETGDAFIHAGWTAMQGSAAASQPFWNEAEDIGMILAGEFFPSEGGTAGNVGRSSTYSGRDAIRRYEAVGEKAFEEWNGLFAALLIDRRQQRAYVLNDRFGVERLYTHQTPEALYFASEAKAILAVCPGTRSLDRAAAAEWVSYGCNWGGRTLFRGIDCVPGATMLRVEEGRVAKRRYFEPAAWESLEPMSPTAWQEALSLALTRAIPNYFVTGSQLGIALTGGLDTRMIMAGRPRNAVRPVCYTFSGEHRDTLDARISQRIAQACGFDHETLRVEPRFFADFATHADRTAFITDGCLGPIGAHEVYFNRRARDLAPIRLTGNYGSEVLRGVSTAKGTSLAPGMASPEFDAAIRKRGYGSVATGMHPVTFAAFKEIPEKRFGILSAGRSQTVFRSPFMDNAVVELAYRAPKGVLNSSRSSLDFIRSSDPVLAQIRTDMGLRASGQDVFGKLTQVFCKTTFKLDYFYNEGLPQSCARLDPFLEAVRTRVPIIGLHKFLHYRAWFRRPLAEYVGDGLEDARRHNQDLWNGDFLIRMRDDHLAGRRNYVAEINAVLGLRAVERTLLQIETPGSARSESLAVPQPVA